MEDDRTSLMSARALNPGYEILWYTIEKVLGQGGFGITYLAHDRNLDRSVAIKEYLPTPFAYRHKDYSVKPLTGDHRDHFAWGLDSFQKEAQTLAKFGHDNIVRVHSVFEQNNTAYMVMEYEDGENLALVYQNRRGDLNQAFFQQIFFPIFDGLKEIHKFGFIHRDIKPANIYIRDNRTPVLIDFGSARETARQQTGEMTTLVTQGYTPLEQYSSNYGEQGPWTDIYALAATIYEGVVGRKPDEALGRSACMLRSTPDLIQPLAASDYPGYTQPFLDALISGLALEPEKRPADLNHWLGEFYGTETTAQVVPREAPPRTTNYFTTLEEDDKTRIQPRSGDRQGNADQSPTGSIQLDQPGKAQLGGRAKPKPRAESLTVALAKAHSTATDAGGPGDRFEFDMDDMDFLNDSGIQPTGSTTSQGTSQEYDDYTERASTQSGAKKSGRGLGSGVRRTLGVIAVAATVGVIGYGTYEFLLKPAELQTTRIDAAFLSGLPTPASPIELVLPKDIVIQQLGAMQVMTALYKQASEIDPDNKELNRSLNSTFQKLALMASQWNASSHPEIAKKIVQVANQMPERGQQKAQLLGLVKSSDQRSNASPLKQQLSAGALVPVGDASVLELVSSLSQADFGEISQSAEWQRMLNQYRQTAVEKIRASDFDAAAKLVAAGLTLQPADTGLGLLRVHLRSL